MYTAINGADSSILGPDMTMQYQDKEIPWDCDTSHPEAAHAAYEYDDCEPLTGREAWEVYGVIFGIPLMAVVAALVAVFA